MMAVHDAARPIAPDQPGNENDPFCSIEEIRLGFVGWPSRDPEVPARLQTAIQNQSKADSLREE
jgi:hypothetical protein